MVSVTDNDDGSGEDLLRAWEQRIEEAGDPLSALADVLGDRSQRRAGLFQLAGQTVSGVRLESILGAGGMGVTYAGRLADGSRVAAKLVPGVGSGDRTRFELECRLLQSLSHPAIVRYRHHGVLDDGTGVLVMDLVEGIDLDRLLTSALVSKEPHGEPAVAALLDEVHVDGPARLQSPRYRRRVLRLLAEVADGLHTAHKAGIVHRDVKPANVLVRADLSPALIDFGLARDQRLRASFTASGAAMGTLCYMAPEQLGRDPGAVTARTDVYAVGLVLFRALLGSEARREIADVVRGSRRPFVLDARQSRQLPVDLQAILYRCLDPRPARRYPDAARLADDLRAAAGQGTVVARRPAGWRRFARDRQRLGRLLAAVVLLVAALTLWFWPRGRYVVFQANVDGALAQVEVDGRSDAYLGAAAWLPYGRHQVTLSARGFHTVSRAFDVAPGGGAQRITLSTFQFLSLFIPWRNEAQAIPVQWMTGFSFEQMAPGVARDRRIWDGRETKDQFPFPLDVIPTPWRHVLRAVDGKGRSEEQTIDLGTEPLDVQMLPAVMAPVDGTFRCTWSTVCSPMPEALTLTTDAERWLGPPTLSSIGGGGLQQAPCALVPPVAGVHASVSLHCRFPEPMRSAVLYLRGLALQGGQLEVEAGFDGEPAQAWPLAGPAEARELARMRAFRSEHGALGFTLRATLGTRIEPTTNLTLVRLFDGMLFGGHWREEPPCFALVADAGDAARLPAPPAPTPVAPEFSATGATMQLPDCEWVVLHPRHGPAGAIELLVGLRPLANPNGEIRRFSWPDATLHSTWPPESVWPHGLPRDGELFGGNLAALADLDDNDWPEVAVGNRTATRGGKVNAGVVVLRRGDAVRWSWPTDAPRAAFGDDEAGQCFAAGDWNGDGHEDLAVSARHSDGPHGEANAGRIEVVDGRTGGTLWQLPAPAPCAQACLLDAWTPARGAAALLFMLAQTTSIESVHAASLCVHRGGRNGTTVAGVMLRPHATELLIPSGAGEPALLVLQQTAANDGFVGIERYSVGDASLDLERRQALSLPTLPEQNVAAEPARAVRTDDLDHDSLGDAAFAVFDAEGRVHVLFVSSRTLQPLGWCTPSDQLAGPRWELGLAWMPAAANVPAQLLVAVRRTIDGEPRVVLQGIVPPR